MIAKVDKVATLSAEQPSTRLNPRRLPTQERARQTVELVLRTAAEEIERDGLDRLTTKRIAAAAGLSVGAIYDYFPNKGSIVHALATEWLEKVREAIDTVHPRHGGQRDAITYLNEHVSLVAALYRDRPGLGALIQMLSAVPALGALTRQHDDMVTANIGSGLTYYAPHADPRQVDAAARSIGIICHNMLCAALVHQVAPAELLFANLRACLLAIVAPLLMAQRS